MRRPKPSLPASLLLTCLALGWLIYQQLAGSPRYQGSIGKPVVSPQNPAERERLLRWARDRFSQAISSDQELQRCQKDPSCLYAGEVLAASSDNERFMLGIH